MVDFAGIKDKEAKALVLIYKLYEEEIILEEEKRDMKSK